jgi:hypothetical protein
LKLRNPAFIASLLLTVTAALPAFAAETSQTIIYSNCDSSLTGTADLRVRFFDDAVAGNLRYEETEAGVTVDASGCFGIVIGNATALSASLFANPSLWIAFALDATPDSELGAGRQPITGNGYAFRAKVAENAQTLPAGATIVADQLGPGLTVQNPNAGGNGLHVTAGNDGIDGTGGFIGVLGHSTGISGRGVAGVADAASGVNYGIYGQALSTTSGAAGVYGISANSGNTFGVIGESPSGTGGRGVWGKATATSGDAIGVYGESNSPGGDGVYGTVHSGEGNAGVHAVSTAFNGNGLIAEANTGPSAYAVWGKSSTGFAGYFDGKVQVNGGMAAHFVQITGGSDLSEKFEVRGEKSQIEPGMVVAIDPVNPGKLAVSAKPYDRRVVGILSGAGGVAPGMLMGQAGTLADGAHPVALSGRVYVWADASKGPIEAGDLLTTSSLPGHAMKVKSHSKAQGAILGKAMTGLDHGRGLVLVLVTLQ